MHRFVLLFARVMVGVALIALLPGPAPADPDDEDTGSAGTPAGLSARSLHMFRETMDGGIQATLIRQGSRSELARVRTELRAGYERDRQGMYPDRKVRGLARSIRVRFDELPTGAQIVFRSSDPKAVEALHEWFAAQVRADRTKHPGGGPGVGQ